MTNPVYINDVDNVATKAFNLNFVMTTALNKPQRQPTASAASTATVGGSDKSCIKIPHVITDIPPIEPIDTFIPPIISAITCDIAIKIYKEVLRTTLNILVASKKLFVINENTRNNTTTAVIALESDLEKKSFIVNLPFDGIQFLLSIIFTPKFGFENPYFNIDYTSFTDFLSMEGENLLITNEHPKNFHNLTPHY